MLCTFGTTTEDESYRQLSPHGCQDGQTLRRFSLVGHGSPWPLLTGERGHYELAAGRDPRVYIRAMENFAEPPGLIA